MGWGHIIAAWFMGPAGKRPSTYRTERRMRPIDLVALPIFLFIIVAGIWPR